jgi:hypothetical protein
MSVSGVSTSDLLQTLVAQGAQTKFQQIQTQFQKLGQDLQSGNLTQAQSDFATLTQELPNRQQSTANATTAAAGGASTPTSTLAKAFQTLGQDLQAGNLSAAQADFATIRQDVQQKSGQPQGHHHHHHGGGQPTNTLQQDFGTLGQALQSGSLTSAQQAYSTLQADFQEQFPNLTTAAGGSTGTPSSTIAGSGSSSVNVTA